MLATVVLLHGSRHHANTTASTSTSTEGSSSSGGGGIDLTTATAVIDAAAYLTGTGDTEGTRALIRLVTDDPATIAAVHVALHAPARRTDSTPSTGSAGGPPPPPLPRRIPSPYRDPEHHDLTPGTPGTGATAPAADRNPTAGDEGLSPGGAVSDRGGAELVPLAETRRWQTAAAAQVLSLDYAFNDAEGRSTGVYTPIPIVHPPGWCDHLDTICAGCLTGWSEDHAVAVFRHGPAGAASGCRCPVCRTTIPTPPHSPADALSPADGRSPADTGPDAGGLPVVPDPNHGTAGRPTSGLTGRGASWFGEEGS